MLAKAVYDVPRGAGLLFEPKWDGFRCVVFRDGDEVVLGSRNDRPLTRYFPELVGALRAALPDRCVVDGEIVVVGSDGLDFEALQQRIHPATSRINRLAEETPASFVAFDLLALGDRDVCDRPFSERRALLEQSMPPDGHPQVRITPITGDPDVAEDWFHRFEGAGFDGVMAKAGDQPYVQDARTMVKVKHQRTADAVVAGFRWHKDGEGIGSLLLGLYDAEGVLHHVGVCSSFKREERAALAEKLGALRDGARETHPWRDWAVFADQDAPQRLPGAASRWNRGKDLSWEPIQLGLVAEVSYDHMQGTRFRHATHFKRWRPDKPHTDCRYDQLDETPPEEIAKIFGADHGA